PPTTLQPRSPGACARGNPRHRTREPKLYPKRPSVSMVAHDSCRHRGLADGGGEHDRALGRAPDGVLEMGRKAAIGGHHGRPVGERASLGAAGVDHRLDGDAEALLYLEAPVGRAVVRDLRVLVHSTADPVADVVAHHAVPLRLDPRLYRRAEVAEPRA